MGQIGRRLVFIILSLSLFGCWESAKKETSSRALRVGIHHNIDHLNVFTQSTTDFWKVQTYLFESLLRIDSATGELKPSLADHWTLSRDQLELTLVLKDGLHWSDGEPLTSDDVVFTLKAHEDPKFRSLYLGIFSQLLKSFKAIDKKTLKFVFRKPSFSNLRDIGLNLLIYPQHVYISGETSQLKATSGAFQFKAFRPGRILQLKSNPHWHGRRDSELKALYQYPELEFYSSAGERELFDMIEDNKIDYFQSLDPRQFQEFSEKLKNMSSAIEAVKAEGYRLLGLRIVSVNHRSSGLNDWEVRKALMQCFDRNHVNQRFFYHLLEPANGPWTRNHPLAPSMAESLMYPYNVKRANHILDKAGWKVNPQTGVREKMVNGKQQRLEFEFLDYDKSNEALLTLFKESAKKIGVKIHVNITGFSEAMRRLKEKSFDLAFHQAQWVAAEPNLRYSYFSEQNDNPYLNVGGVSDKVLDQLILQLEAAKTAKQRAALYKKAYQRIAQRLPDLFWFHDRYVFYFVNKRVIRPQDTLPYSIGLATWRLSQ